MKTTLMIGTLAGVCAVAQASDNDVKWDYLNHLPAYDLRPMVPMDNEAFEVRFQSEARDLTSARVWFFRNGIPGGTVDAALVGQEGAYDVWSATIPQSDPGVAEVSYFIEVTDGSDTDYLTPDGPSSGFPSSDFRVNFDTLMHARLGATPVEGGTVFKVWAPGNTTCFVRGTFNNNALTDELTKVGEYFIGFVEGAVPANRYRYYFDDAHWATDPTASVLFANDNYSAIIQDPLAYEWQSDDFVARPLEELVIYQLHIGTFAGRNDPAGSAGNPSGYVDVVERVEHLKDLGVNAVMLNPINEFPGSQSGGYNPISMYAWEFSYGSPGLLKLMVDTLHQNGIAVILDVVWNHFSASDNFLWNFGGSQQYYDTPEVGTPWGPQADFDRAGVREYFLESVHHVMGEFRMDGYRHDAVMAMTDSGWTPQWPQGQGLMRDMNASIERRYKDAHTIAEIYIDSPWVQTGIGFDSQYHNGFKEAMRGAVFGSAFGSPNVGAVADVMDGTAVSGRAVMNYFELHDDAWPLNGHERAVKEIDTTAPHDDGFARGRTTLANGLTLFSKGVPAILQGTEWLEDDGWEENKIDWAHKAQYDGVFDFYKAAIAMRTSEPALYADSGAWSYHVNEGLDVFAVERWEVGGKSFVVVANFSSSDRVGYRVGLPREGRWGVALNSQDVVFGGSGVGSEGLLDVDAIANGPHPRSAALTIPALGMLVLEHEPEVVCAADLDSNGSLNFGDVSAFLTLYGAGDSAADLDGNGSLNFGDVSAFLTFYGQGCP